MTQNQVASSYFEWLCSLVERSESTNSNYRFTKLLSFLHNNSFRHIHPMDENRANDGIGLRREFGLISGFDYSLLTGPCSVLEMLIALAIRIENDICYDVDYGERIDQWFWNMVVNIGFGGMTDGNWKPHEAEMVLKRFLNREYRANGVGSIFTIHTPGANALEVDLWTQMLWHFSELE